MSGQVGEGWALKKPEASWVEYWVSSVGNSGCYLTKSGIKEEIFISLSSI